MSEVMTDNSKVNAALLKRAEELEAELLNANARLDTIARTTGDRNAWAVARHQKPPLSESLRTQRSDTSPERVEIAEGDVHE